MISSGERLVGMPPNYDILVELFDYQRGDDKEKIINLNSDESIRARFFSDGKQKGVLLEFIREEDSLLSFRLVGDRLDSVGFKGIVLGLQDEWFNYNEYVEVNRRDVKNPDTGIFPIIADFAVELVLTSVNKKRIQEVDLQLKLAPRHPR